MGMVSRPAIGHGQEHAAALFAREDEARGTVSVMEKAFPETGFILSRTLEGFPDPILEPGVES